MREYAMQLTSLRHDLNKTNGLVRDFLGEAAFERETETVKDTEEKSARTNTPPAPVTRPAAEPAPEPEEVRPETQTPFALRRWIAISALGVCALLAFQFGGDHTTSPMHYDSAAFEIAGLLEAIAVPPDLFVRVDPTVWERLDSAEKQHMIDLVAAHELAGGCANVLFMDAHGHPIVRWSRETVVALDGTDGE